MQQYNEKDIGNSAVKSLRNKLFLALAMTLPSISGNTETFQVTEPYDDGVGQPGNTLSWAIQQANENTGPDKIHLNTDVNITGVMRRLIDSDVTIQSSPRIPRRFTIDGNDRYRPIFIKSGHVNIDNIHITNGRAEGGSGSNSGAGLGGAVFIYDGQVNLSRSSISHSTAKGGHYANSSNHGSGGGMFGNSGYGVSSSTWGDDSISGGGGLFDDGQRGNGAYGGFGHYQTQDPRFGEGGDFLTERPWPGGFGGGGGACIGIESYGFLGGDGGFGGGAGICRVLPFYGIFSSSGKGGFGGSGVPPGFGAASSTDELNNFTGHQSAGADLGGGIFIRAGHLNISNVTLAYNEAIKGGLGAKGYGGGIFVMHTTDNQSGSNQGMPSTLPTVDACSLRFKGNFSSHEDGTHNLNHHVFDLANRINMNSDQRSDARCGAINPEP